jgi:hypothetical protein
MIAAASTEPGVSAGKGASGGTVMIQGSGVNFDRRMKSRLRIGRMLAPDSTHFTLVFHTSISHPLTAHFLFPLGRNKRMDNLLSKQSPLTADDSS